MTDDACTRLAPTPSGFLHEGNLVNLALVRATAEALGTRVLLRIDDADTDRLRPEYVQDIFRVLEWVGMVPDVGPHTPTDLNHWSQATRRERYWAALVAMELAGAPVFTCTCSRAVLTDGSCTAGCMEPVARYAPTLSAVRLRREGGDVGCRPQGPRASAPDHVAPYSNKRGAG